jgi:hypothetical protein
MSDVSYQAFLDDISRRGGDQFVPVRPESLETRRRDAERKRTIRISKEQERWLEQIEAITGKGIDGDAVIRVLIDLGRQLDIDWPMTAGVPALRRAVAESVRVRTTTRRG